MSRRYEVSLTSPARKEVRNLERPIASRVAEALDPPRARIVHFITFDADGIFDSTEWDAAADASISACVIPALNANTPVIDARA